MLETIPFAICRACVLVLLIGIRLVWPEIAQAGNYTLSAAGDEVADPKTGLIWRRCVEGMNWNGNTCTGSPSYFMWQDALQRAEAQAQAAGKAWRLPNVKELASLVDTDSKDLAIDTAAFPATPNDQFWSSSPYAWDAFYAWIVHSYYGSTYYSYLEDNAAVRLVRD